MIRRAAGQVRGRIPKHPPGDDRIGHAGLTGETRSLLRRFGLAPNRRLGQNFLVDTYVLGKIIAAARIDSDSRVLEIGPGLGTLTEALIAVAQRVLAVEIDSGLAALLRARFATSANLTIVEGDALQLEPGDLIDESYTVVANIPYYATSGLLRHLLEARHRPDRITVMLQKEVADRIVSPPGRLSLLAVSVQFHGEARIAGRVPATAFYPRPEVDSAILTIDVLPRPRVDVPVDQFFKTVAAGFAMPRKQLHNAIAQRIWFAPGGAAEALKAAGIGPERRAQTVSLDEWAALTRVLMERGAL